MMHILGFGYVPYDTAMAIMIGAVVVAAVVGWITDAIMRDTGLGMVGNTALVELNIMGTLIVWNRFVAPLMASDPLSIITVIAANTILLFILVAMLKRLA